MSIALVPRWLPGIIGLVWLVALAACGLLAEPEPSLADKHTYDGHGLVFDYPGNWKQEVEVSESDGIETVNITVESSGSAIAMIQQFKPAIGLDPDQMFGLMTVEMREAAGEQLGGMLDYAAGESRKSTRTMLGGEREVRRASFHVALLGEKVPHTFELTVAELGDRSIAVLTQAADEDLAKVEPGFAQIFGSLKVR